MKRLQIVNELKGFRRQEGNDHGEAPEQRGERHEMKSSHHERETQAADCVELHMAIVRDLDVTSYAMENH